MATKKKKTVAGILAMAAAVSMSALTAPSALAGGATQALAPQARGSVVINSNNGTGVEPGTIKHVWVILLENKSYDATFSSLNPNSYLWKDLPAQGALLDHYFGTSHYSMGNYTSMVSGQSASYDIQSDCSVENFDFADNSHIQKKHVNAAGQPVKPFSMGDTYGQAVSGAGANAENGENGCTYPKQVPTLFNQLDAAGISWKSYAQDLGNQPGREDALGGAPGSRNNMAAKSVQADPNTTSRRMKASSADKAQGISSFTGGQTANPATGQHEDYYVAKHFPNAWFHSLNGTDNTGRDALTTPIPNGIKQVKENLDSDAAHIANQEQELVKDLQLPADQVPAFNWITPNNCSDAHDSSCGGNNLSGAFTADGKPNYKPAGVAPYMPQLTKPKNHVGGLYAADLWLRYYIPLIMASDAYHDGGLIEITFDEANPPFAGMSFNNATDDTKTAAAARKNMVYQYKKQTMADLARGYEPYAPHTFPAPSLMAKNYVLADQAGQNINGENINMEPQGPNSTLMQDKNGNQLAPGQGDNGYIQRPEAGTGDDQVPGAKNFDGSPRKAASSKTVTQAMPQGSTTLNLNSISVTDLGRAVTGDGIPEGAYIGQVQNALPDGMQTFTGMTKNATTDTYNPWGAGIVLVDKDGKELKTTADIPEGAKVTLSAQGTPGHLQEGETPYPTFDAQDATPGGGNVGAVLLSPYIKPGTVSHTYYNHYSNLRTWEDLLNVTKGIGSEQDHKLVAGTVAGGLDGFGHLGYAAQAGLKPMGTDVFTKLPAPAKPSESESPKPSGTPSATAAPSSSSAAAQTPTHTPGSQAPGSGSQNAAGASATPHAGHVAFTGADVTGLAIVALALALVGGGAVAVRRKHALAGVTPDESAE
ncbi:MAG: alkaline phosphatase family protein [Actinomycetaceae bacterium]|nr:alkaline phosphatase family protein [Actinomycetaceae bacterium]MDY6082277.1 alkaline phosphatase family protein [Actinomycetaceae bacterium]